MANQTYKKPEQRADFIAANPGRTNRFYADAFGIDEAYFSRMSKDVKFATLVKKNLRRVGLKNILSGILCLNRHWITLRTAVTGVMQWKSYLKYRLKTR